MREHRTVEARFLSGPMTASNPFLGMIVRGEVEGLVVNLSVLEDCLLSYICFPLDRKHALPRCPLLDLYLSSRYLLQLRGSRSGRESTHPFPQVLPEILSSVTCGLYLLITMNHFSMN